jgi:hypothetical protein
VSSSILVAFYILSVTLVVGHAIPTTVAAPPAATGAHDSSRFGLDDHLVVLIVRTNANAQAPSTDSAVPMTLVVVHKEWL